MQRLAEERSSSMHAQYDAPLPPPAYYPQKDTLASNYVSPVPSDPFIRPISPSFNPDSYLSRSTKMPSAFDDVGSNPLRSAMPSASTAHSTLRQRLATYGF